MENDEGWEREKGEIGEGSFVFSFFFKFIFLAYFLKNKFCFNLSFYFYYWLIILKINQLRYYDMEFNEAFKMTWKWCGSWRGSNCITHTEVGLKMLLVSRFKGPDVKHVISAYHLFS